MVVETPMLKYYEEEWDSNTIDDRCNNGAESVDERKQLLVPTSKEPEVLQQFHDGSTGALLEVQKALKKNSNGTV